MQWKKAWNKWKLVKWLIYNKTPLKHTFKSYIIFPIEHKIFSNQHFHNHLYVGDSKKLNLKQIFFP